MPQHTRLTKKGGEQWTIDGFYSSNSSVPRIVKVKHYKDSGSVQISIGTTAGKAKAASGLTVERAEEMAEAIFEACEKARQVGEEYHDAEQT